MALDCSYSRISIDPKIQISPLGAENMRRIIHVIIQTTLLLSIFIVSACSNKIKQVTLEDSIYLGLDKTTIGYWNNHSQMSFLFEDAYKTVIIPGLTIYQTIDAPTNKMRRQKSAEVGSPIRTVLSGFDYDEKIKQAFLNLLSKKGFKNIQKIQNHSGFKRDVVEKGLIKENGDAFGLIWPTLQMSKEFDEIILMNVFSLYPIREDLMDLADRSTDENKKRPILKTFSIARVKLENATVDIKENVLLWTANDGSKIKEALNTALVVVMGDIRLKLNMH